MRRPLRIGAFDVVDGRIVVVDRVLPVAAELDPTGAVVSVWQWPLDPARRGRPTANDVLLTTSDIVVASPAAGGVVRIDRRSGTARLVPVDDDVGRLVTDGDRDLIWAVADPDREGAYEPGLASPDRRTVVWEEPTAADMERFRAEVAGWRGRAPDADGGWVPLADPSDPIPSAADWQARLGDDETDRIGPPTPVWRLGRDGATRVDLGGDLAALAVVDGTVVAVCQLPSDPLIKVVEPGGFLSYVRPGTVLVGDGGSFTAIGTVAESSGTIVVDGRDVWLLGFCRRFGAEASEVRRVDVGARTVSAPVPAEPEVVAVLRGRTASLRWHRQGRDAHAHGPVRPGRVLRLTTGSGPATDLSLPRVDDSPVVDGAAIWFCAHGAAALVRVEVESGAVDEIAVHVECAELLPAVRPPDGVDPAAFETRQRDALRSSCFGGWRDQSGERRPFIRGVTFESIELDGSFPTTAVVATFRSVDRPGVLFGRRWRLWDDLGNPTPAEYADVHLLEAVEAAGHGLPPLAACRADEGGIVWF